MGPVGPELNSRKTTQLTDNKELNDTEHHIPTHERVHNPVRHTVFCSGLQQIIDHWDSLPEHIKAAIQTNIMEMEIK